MVGGSERLTMRLAAELEAIDRWSQSLRDFFADRGIPAELADELSLVFDELLSNIIRYGGCSVGVEPIEVGIALDGARLEGWLIDDGVEFDPSARPSPELDLDLDERAIGGLGVHIARTLTDSFAYERRDGLNHVHFTKQLEHSG